MSKVRKQLNLERSHLYQSGLSDIEIADKQGVSRKAIRTWRKLRKLPSNRKKFISKKINWIDAERGLIAGYLDCDGTICLSQDKDDYIHPRIGFFNTSFILVENSKSVLKVDNKIAETIREGRKPIYTLNITRMDTVLSILKEVEPFLVRKKRHSQLVRQFIEERFREIESGKFHGGYSDGLYSIFKEFKKL